METVLDESRDNLNTLTENYNSLHSDLQQYQQIDLKVIEQKVDSITSNMDQYPTKRDFEQEQSPPYYSGIITV